MKFTRLVPAAIAAVALLAGCSPTAGTALVVDGTRFTEAQIDEISAGCAEALEIGPDQIRRAGVVGTLILGKVFDSFGTEVVEQDLQALSEQQGSGQLFSNAACKPLAIADAKIQLMGSLDEATVLQAASGLDVQLNPRYGKWQPESGALIDPSGSLSVPVVLQ